MPGRQQSFDFDLDDALASVVSIATRIPERALTATVLGTERQGHGALIGDGDLIVTIGYLVAEAEAVWLTGRGGRPVPGYVVGYDYETGLGLVRPTGRLDSGRLPIGRSADLAVGEPVIAAGHGGRTQAVQAAVVARREFAGYWEYVLDEAIFTSPAHPNWGGAALLGADGRLYGVGSLLVQNAEETDGTDSANMFVPIDLLAPIVGDLCRYGMRRGPARPWLGLFVQEINGCLAVSGMYANGPAAQAGLEPGDIVTTVGDEPVSGLADLFRRVWSQGEAGCDVALGVVRGNAPRTVTITSVDRNALMRGGTLH